MISQNSDNNNRNKKKGTITTTTGEKLAAADALRLLLDAIHLRNPLPLGSTAGLMAIAPTSVPNA